MFRERIKKECPGAKIVDAHIHYAFVCQLDLLWRNRKFNKRISKTDPVNSAVPITEFMLWDIEGNKAGDFEKILESTCYSETCKTCHGKGHLECSGCHGSGNEECSECYGHEPHKCPDCGGKGAVWHECTACNGTGRRCCAICDGTGLLKCPECKGSGTKAGSSGRYTCSNCKGVGYVTCPSCNGRQTHVCPVCGGSKGDSIQCEKCKGMGELHHCAKCHDKGVVTCHVCKGNKKLHCKECGDKGHHTWIYYLLQQEFQKTLKSVSRSWTGDRQEYYEKESEKADYEKMSFDISDGVNIQPEKIPETVRLRIMKMWQAMFVGKEFKDFDETKVDAKEELSKINPCLRNGDWDSRLLSGKLIVTKIDTHAFVNIKWKGKPSTLFFEPGAKKFILSRALREEKSRVGKSCARRKNILASIIELFALSGLVYLIGVHYNWFLQPAVKHYLSIGMEHYLALQIWLGETYPGVYNFWNWPAVLSLMALSIGMGSHNAGVKSLGTIVGVILGIPSAIILLVALPFMDGISWYLALLVDVMAFLTLVALGAMINDRNVPLIFKVASEFLVFMAIAYVVLHFFI